MMLESERHQEVCTTPEPEVEGSFGPWRASIRLSLKFRKLECDLVGEAAAEIVRDVQGNRRDKVALVR